MTARRRLPRTFREPGLRRQLEPTGDPQGLRRGKKGDTLCTHSTLLIRMTAHVPQTEIERLARGAASPRVQRHLFACEGCLRRLVDVHARSAGMEANTADIARRL